MEGPGARSTPDAKIHFSLLTSGMGSLVRTWRQPAERYIQAEQPCSRAESIEDEKADIKELHLAEKPVKGKPRF